MKYDIVVGLELHAELNTKTKVFSSSSNIWSEIANTNVSPLDIGLPGTLPEINKEAVIKALKMAIALNCDIPKYLIFDRKNYFYPDLPKGYQITQSHYPIGINGYIELNNKKYLIHDIHLEEDSASLDHFDDFSLIDYNRSGVPLIEIVTEPCFNSAKEVIDYLENIKNILKYLDISNADTKKGQIRCDVNVSLKEKDSPILGCKVEMKNINSFANVFLAINAEVERQKKLLDNHEKVKQETRRYDEATNTTIRMREKVESIDYKYFIEPNLPKYRLTDELINSLKAKMPILPNKLKDKYLKEYQLDEKSINIIIKEKYLIDYFEECLKMGIKPNICLNWLTTDIIGYLNKNNLNSIDYKPIYLKEIIDSLDHKKISSKQAKEIFNESINKNIDPLKLISETDQVSDKDDLTKIIKELVNNNLNLKEDYLKGKTNIFDYFVGQIMKETRGKANIEMTKNILDKELNGRDND